MWVDPAAKPKVSRTALYRPTKEGKNSLPHYFSYYHYFIHFFSARAEPPQLTHGRRIMPTLTGEAGSFDDQDASTVGTTLATNHLPRSLVGVIRQLPRQFTRNQFVAAATSLTAARECFDACISRGLFLENGSHMFHVSFTTSAVDGALLNARSFGNARFDFVSVDACVQWIHVHVGVRLSRRSLQRFVEWVANTHGAEWRSVAIERSRRYVTSRYKKCWNTHYGWYRVSAAVSRAATDRFRQFHAERERGGGDVSHCIAIDHLTESFPPAQRWDTYDLRLPPNVEEPASVVSAGIRPPVSPLLSDPYFAATMGANEDITADPDTTNRSECDLTLHDDNVEDAPPPTPLHAVAAKDERSPPGGGTASEVKEAYDNEDDPVEEDDDDGFQGGSVSIRHNDDNTVVAAAAARRRPCSLCRLPILLQQEDEEPKDGGTSPWTSRHTEHEQQGEPHPGAPRQPFCLSRDETTRLPGLMLLLSLDGEQHQEAMIAAMFGKWVARNDQHGTKDSLSANVAGALADKGLRDGVCGAPTVPLDANFIAEFRLCHTLKHLPQESILAVIHESERTLRCHHHNHEDHMGESGGMSRWGASDGHTNASEAAHPPSVNATEKIHPRPHEKQREMPSHVSQQAPPVSDVYEESLHRVLRYVSSLVVAATSKEEQRGRRRRSPPPPVTHGDVVRSVVDLHTTHACWAALLWSERYPLPVIRAALQTCFFTPLRPTTLVNWLRMGRRHDSDRLGCGRRFSRRVYSALLVRLLTSMEPWMERLIAQTYPSDIHRHWNIIKEAPSSSRREGGKRSIARRHHIMIATFGAASALRDVLWFDCPRASGFSVLPALRSMPAAFDEEEAAVLAAEAPSVSLLAQHVADLQAAFRTAAPRQRQQGCHPLARLLVAAPEEEHTSKTDTTHIQRRKEEAEKVARRGHGPSSSWWCSSSHLMRTAEASALTCPPMCQRDVLWACQVAVERRAIAFAAANSMPLSFGDACS